MWNIDSLSQEGAKNEKNPGRAIGKAAAYTAGAYLGGLLGALLARVARLRVVLLRLLAMPTAAVQAGMTADQAAQLAAAQPGPGLLGNAYSSWASDSPGAGVVAPGMQEAPQQTMYGGGGMYGMDEETKRKLREAGYLV
jgi:hypothetical protein